MSKYIIPLKEDNPEEKTVSVQINGVLSMVPRGIATEIEDNIVNVLTSAGYELQRVYDAEPEQVAPQQSTETQAAVPAAPAVSMPVNISTEASAAPQPQEMPPLATDAAPAQSTPVEPQAAIQPQNVTVQTPAQ